MAEASREEAAWGIVVPDLRHVGVVEQVVLTRHEAGARMAVLVANVVPSSRRTWRRSPCAPGLPFHR